MRYPFVPRLTPMRVFLNTGWPPPLPPAHRALAAGKRTHGNAQPARLAQLADEDTLLILAQRPTACGDAAKGRSQQSRGRQQGARLSPHVHSRRGGADPRESSANGAVQSLPAAASRAARAAAWPRLDVTQPGAPPPSGAGRQLLDGESILAASVGQPDREAPGGPEGARSEHKRLRPHPARRGVGGGAGGRREFCRKQVGLGGDQLALRGSSHHAPGCPELRSASASQPRRPRLPATSASFSTQALSFSRSRTDLRPPSCTTS